MSTTTGTDVSSGYWTRQGSRTRGRGDAASFLIDNVTNLNLNSNPAYSKAVAAQNAAEDAADDADSAYSKAQSVEKTARTLNTTVSAIINGNYTGGTFINNGYIYSPTIVGSEIFWGTNGAYGSLTRTYGDDGRRRTDIIELYSNAGIVLNASTNMRFEATGLWINIDYTDVHVRNGNRYVDLGSLIKELAPAPSA